MKRDTIAILSLVAVFALQGCLTIGAIVVDMEPAFVPIQLRILKAALAAFNIGGGLAIAFYFQAKYGDSWPLVIAGVVLFGACYFGYYGGWEQMKEWIGKGYGLLLAIYDTLLIRRGMECVSIGQKETQAGLANIDAERRQEANHRRQIELLQAEGAKKVAETKAATELEQAVAKRVKAEKEDSNFPTGKRQKLISFPSRPDLPRVSFLDFMAEWQGRGTERGFVPEYAKKNGMSVDTVYKWARRAKGG